MHINQNPISSKTLKKVKTSGLAGGLSLSVLTLGLWFGGAAQADTNVNLV